MIKIENLKYSYKKNADEILKGLNFDIQDGDFVAVIGQNGAGKTTFLKQLNGLLKPTSGRVLLNGMDTKDHKTSALSKQIGYLFQNPDNQIFSNTVYEEILFGIKGEPDADSRIKAVALRLGLEKTLEQNPFTLSRGERQRVALASVLARDTKVLVLDEPTTGQDYLECMEIMGIIRELNESGKTIVMVSHDMEVVADFAKRCIVLCDGVVIEDSDTMTALRKADHLKRAGLIPPQMVELSLLLGDGFSKVNTLDALYSKIKGEVAG